MLKNYLTVALRNLWKSKFYSLINIAGLAIGLACFFFILIFVQDELSYDRFHEKADRIYRVNFEGHAFDQDLNFAVVGAQLGPTVKDQYPEVVQYCRFRQRGSFSVQYEDQAYLESALIFADSTFFDVFSFDLLKGNPDRVLAEPQTLVISEDIARKYFGEEEAIGKSLRLDNNLLYRVTGVMKPMPKNSHFHFDLLASLSTLEESNNPTWLNNNFQTYLVLAKGADPAAVQEKFPDLVRTYMGPELEKFMGKTFDDIVKGGDRIDFALFPLTKIHLYSDKIAELGANSDIKYVYIFTFIGIFILLLACVNFINLSTARSFTRAKEVGMRKVVGARRSQLIVQFLSESFVIAVLALLIAGVALMLLLPYFNELSGKLLVITQVVTPSMLGLILGLVLLVALIAGSYPALHLSSFRPVTALKSSLLGGRKQRVSLRSILVVFQFAITVGLIVGTMIISNQLKYISNKKLGFDKSRVLILNNYYTLGNNCLPFKEEMLKHPQVVNASISGSLPTPSNRNTSATFLGRNPDPERTHVCQLFTVDYDYIPTLEMEVLEGRAFSRDFPADSSAMLINESAVAMYGLDEPLGQEVSLFRGGTPENPIIRTYRVVGVVSNFHFESLRSKIGPLVMFLGDSRGNLSIKLKPGDVKEFIADLQQKWQEMAPGQPFDYTFMEEDFATMYESEARIGNVFSIFTVLAIFIACLGLFGLATFTARQRTKELGIRKVIGASVGGLFVLLTTEVLKWVLIANLIALPIAYLLMKRWLAGFAYPVLITWQTFFLALVAGVGIALVTVSYQALRAAIMNPIQSLRQE